MPYKGKDGTPALEDEDYISEDGQDAFEGFLCLISKINTLEKKAHNGTKKAKPFVKK